MNEDGLQEEYSVRYSTTVNGCSERCDAQMVSERACVVVWWWYTRVTMMLVSELVRHTSTDCEQRQENLSAISSQCLSRFNVQNVNASDAGWVVVSFALTSRSQTRSSGSTTAVSLKAVSRSLCECVLESFKFWKQVIQWHVCEKNNFSHSKCNVRVFQT